LQVLSLSSSLYIINATLEMDPNYSILLGDKNTGDCAQTTTTKIGKSKDTKKTVAIVVPVVIVVLVVAGLLVFFAPRYPPLSFCYLRLTLII
jgi:hypothetical protein